MLFAGNREGEVVGCGTLLLLAPFCEREALIGHLSWTICVEAHREESLRACSFCFVCQTARRLSEHEAKQQRILFRALPSATRYWSCFRSPLVSGAGYLSFFEEDAERECVACDLLDTVKLLTGGR